jgi:hypothetical protein
VSFRPLALAVLLLLAASAPGAEVAPAAPAADPPIKVTVNPEGRVSVTLLGALPPPAAYGTPVEFGVRIVNQGFLTGVLEARLAGDPPAAAVLEFDPSALRGVPVERRILRITLTGRALTDLTIAFRLRHEAPDLGGRDRVHLLMQGK